MSIGWVYVEMKRKKSGMSTFENQHSRWRLCLAQPRVMEQVQAPKIMNS